MDITNFNILINDTFVAGTVLNIESTERANPVLKYNGSDDEFQPIMASELSFNMLVETAEDAKFLHLFTGNETRYEVQLQNATTLQILWQGFLLPDLYSEPYENGCFFVSFTATDGLGRLKNKYLSDSFYNETKTLPQIIGECLRLTGLNFHTVIAPAITSAATSIYVSDQTLNTRTFVEGDKRKDAYAILESVISSMCCKLFLWGEKWYVVGINRFNETEVACEFYSGNGWRYVADGIESFTRTINGVVFEATPIISVIPPNKNVSVTWNKSERTNVLPLDLVDQKPTDFTVFGSPVGTLAPKYFSKTGTSFSYFLDYKNYRNQSLISSGSLTEYPTRVTLEGMPSAATIESNYISLLNPIYVVGEIDGSVTMDVEIEVVVSLNQTNTRLSFLTEDLAEKILYEITIGGITIASNKSSFDTDSLYDFKFESEFYTRYSSKATKVSIKDLAITTSGYLDIKLHPIINVGDSNITNQKVMYNKFEINYKSKTASEETVVKTRAIDFTVEKEVAINHSYNWSGLTENAFKISPYTSFSGYDVVTTSQDVQLPIINYVSESYAVVGGTKYANSFLISYASYIKIKENPTYVNVWVASLYTYVKATNYLLYYSNTFEQYIIKCYGFNAALTSEDKLYIKIPESVENKTDRIYLNQLFKRVNTVENISYLEAVAKIYHSTVRDAKFKIEGNLFGIYGPLDIFQFRYLQPKNYNATNLTINLAEGQTQVVLVESANKEITDYE